MPPVLLAVFSLMTMSGRNVYKKQLVHTSETVFVAYFLWSYDIVILLNPTYCGSNSKTFSAMTCVDFCNGRVTATLTFLRNKCMTTVSFSSNRISTCMDHLWLLFLPCLPSLMFGKCCRRILTLQNSSTTVLKMNERYLTNMYRYLTQNNGWLLTRFALQLRLKPATFFSFTVPAVQGKLLYTTQFVIKFVWMDGSSFASHPVASHCFSYQGGTQHIRHSQFLLKISAKICAAQSRKILNLVKCFATCDWSFGMKLSHNISSYPFLFIKMPLHGKTNTRLKPLIECCKTYNHLWNRSAELRLSLVVTSSRHYLSLQKVREKKSSMLFCNDPCYGKTSKFVICEPTCAYMKALILKRFQTGYLISVTVSHQTALMGRPLSQFLHTWSVLLKMIL